MTRTSKAPPLVNQLGTAPSEIDKCGEAIGRHVLRFRRSRVGVSLHRPKPPASSITAVW
jgi:hypothetical protein